jgi:chromate reductase
MTVRGSEATRILGIPGGMRRRRSHNVRLLGAAAEIAGARADFTYFLQSSLGRLPIYSPDDEIPTEVRDFRENLTDSDAVLISTPEYIGSLPGGIKNALDWAALAPGGSVLEGKPVAVIGADEGEFGGDWAQADARKILDSAEAEVVEAGLAVPFAEEAFDSEGMLVDRRAVFDLGVVVNQLVAAARVSVRPVEEAEV